MKPEDPEIPLENVLRSLPFRSPPAQLRSQVLAAAHHSAHTPWRRIWPPPAAWMGLAALWLLIAAVSSFLSATGPRPPQQPGLVQSKARASEKPAPARPTLLAVQLHFRP
ncbi:MAG: hypothetical protein RLZZ253_3097 [Verrucomicrobiota bacterium]